METIFSSLGQIINFRQEHTIQHQLSDIVMIVFFAHLANCDDWEDVALFSQRYEEILKKVLPLENGLPSIYTIRRVIQFIQPSVFEEINKLWNELLLDGKQKAFKKILAIDGKTMRGNHQNGSKPQHIITAYSVEDGLCLGQVATQVESNEITAIPKLLKALHLKKSHYYH